MVSSMRALAGALLDLIFPPCCRSCRQPLPTAETECGLCCACGRAVELLVPPICVRCGRTLPGEPGGENRWCASCLLEPPPFDSARSLARYAPPVSTLLQALKFNGDHGAARTLSALAPVSLPPFDIVVPVPLHDLRLRLRGFNQSLVLARRLLPDRRDVITHDALVRRKDTAAQTGLTGRQRRRNLNGAFEVVRPGLVSGSRILVIDDVFTTGTTVAECARTLKEAGAAAVHVWTVARVDDRSTGHAG